MLQRGFRLFRTRGSSFDEPMKDYTTFRVGGPAKWMAAPQDEQQLRVILKICSELQVPCFILDAAAICL